MTADDWDRRYRDAAPDHGLVWSPGPNRTVEDLLTDRTPGTAIDLGAGEGRHALWLSSQGWTVTAVDFSRVALDRGRTLEGGGPGEVEWVSADVTAWGPPAPVDLVLVAYLHLASGPLTEVLGHLPGWVGPGGTLLVLGHDRDNLTRGIGGPQDPDVLYTPSLLEEPARAANLHIERCEQIRRPVEKDGRQVQAIDTVLLARRARD